MAVSHGGAKSNFSSQVSRCVFESPPSCGSSRVVSSGVYVLWGLDIVFSLRVNDCIKKELINLLFPDCETKKEEQKYLS